MKETRGDAMNEFIKLRKTYVQDENSTDFSIRFLETYMNKYRMINTKEDSLFKNVERIKRLSLKSNPSQAELMGSLMNLGDNDYLDRLIVNLLIQKQHQLSKKIFGKTILKLVTSETINEAMLFSLIDICIECDMNLLKNFDLKLLFTYHKNNYDSISILIDYMYHFKITTYQDFLYDFIKEDLPDSIKIQILSLLEEVYLINLTHQEPIRAMIKSKKIYEDYVRTMKQKNDFDHKGLVLVQSMFHGDFDSNGKGNNGGIAVLLKSLGKALSENDKVAMVVSVSINNEWSDGKPLIHSYSNHHILIRMPIYISDSDKDPYVKKEHFIVRFTQRFLEKIQINPDIFHIRYLDNASKSMATLCERLGKKLVFTLTPDPHRNMFEENGQLKSFDHIDYLSRLNRIGIGDELIYKSDGILGIGKVQVKIELEEYFPQLTNKVIGRKLIMMDEAIDATPLKDEESNEEAFNQLIGTLGIPKDFFENPVMLNVGRLNQMKGQGNLIKAWGNSRFSNDYRLLIIGGDIDNPNEEEQKVMETFESYLKAKPYLKNRFCHVAALSNSDIRILEKKIMSKTFELPHIYLCSSQKEEFGIAILEALSVGYLVIAPKEGGVKSYIKQGINGFMVNTQSWSAIAEEAEEIIYKSDISNEIFRRIQRKGRETVLKYFTMDKVSQEMLTFYLSLEKRKA